MSKFNLIHSELIRDIKCRKWVFWWRNESETSRFRFRFRFCLQGSSSYEDVRLGIWQNATANRSKSLWIWEAESGMISLEHIPLVCVVKWRPSFARRAFGDCLKRSKWEWASWWCVSATTTKHINKCRELCVRRAKKDVDERCYINSTLYYSTLQSLLDLTRLELLNSFFSSLHSPPCPFFSFSLVYTPTTLSNSIGTLLSKLSASILRASVDGDGQLELCVQL